MKNGTLVTKIIRPNSKQKGMTPEEVGIKIESSNGRSSGGRIVKYIRPVGSCSNKSRKISGFTGAEVREKIDNAVKKWYSPMVIFYRIKGWIIGSNSKQNALKEFYKLCDLKDVGKEFPVEAINNF